MSNGLSRADRDYLIETAGLLERLVSERFGKGELSIPLGSGLVKHMARCLREIEGRAGGEIDGQAKACPTKGEDAGICK